MITALADGRLLADRTGQSPASVIALHGWGRTGADFAAIVHDLDALSVHLPGFGVTPEPDTVWGSEDYADALIEALDGHPPVILVGHSFGGRVAVRLAAARPDLVRGLVLTGVPLLRLTAAPKPALSYRATRWLAKRRLVPNTLLERQRRRHGSADYLAAQGVMRDIMVRVVGEDYRDDLTRITAPVRMVWGADDTAAPADAGEAASKHLRNARFRRVPGAAHLLEGTLAGEVRNELLDLIASLEAPSAETGKVDG